MKINKKDLRAIVNTVKECQEAMKIMEVYENIMKSEEHNVLHMNKVKLF